MKFRKLVKNAFVFTFTSSVWKWASSRFKRGHSCACSNWTQAFKVADWSMQCHRGARPHRHALVAAVKPWNCWRVDGAQTVPVWGVFNGREESFHARLVSWQMEYQKIYLKKKRKSPTNSLISKHREKSCLLWRCCRFSSYKRVNIYSRIRESGNYICTFLISEMLDSVASCNFFRASDEV